jgi:hypothetical protein
VVRICQNSFGELRRLLKLSNVGQRDHKPIRGQIIHQQNKGSFFIYLFVICWINQPDLYLVTSTTHAVHVILQEKKFDWTER